VTVVLDRVRALADSDELQLATHLIETAFYADPESSEVHRLRAEVYEARAAAERSSMAANLFNHAARASRKGKRDLADKG
jgi:alkyl sulfatase BDS1-like metallo-beta-lactamase superfamily hydrolase